MWKFIVPYSLNAMKGMKRLVCILLVVGQISVMNAQGYKTIGLEDKITIAYDDFSNNTDYWSESTGQECDFQFNRGYFNIYRKVANGSCGSHQDLGLDSKRDFEIETVVKKISGVQDKGYGLAFGVKDNANGVLFLISGNGYYKVTSFTNGVWEDQISWVKHGSIKTGDGAQNKLTVRKLGRDLNIYINENFVSSLNAKGIADLPGNNIGYVIYGEQKIALDWLHISYLNITEPVLRLKDIFVKQQITDNPPLLTIQDISFDQSTLEAYETGTLKITIKNTGPGEAKNVMVSLSSLNQDLTLGSESISSIAANGGTQTVSIPIKAKPEIQTGTASVSVEVFEPNFKVKVQGNPISFNTRKFRNPNLIVVKFAVVEYQSANPNNQVDINEMIEVKLAIQNTGQGAAENLKVDVTNNQNGVLYLGRAEGSGITQNKASFSQLAAGSYETLVYRFFVNSDFTASSLNFSIKASEKIGKYGVSESKSVPINTQLKAEGYIRQIAVEEDALTDVILAQVPDFVSDVDKNIPVSTEKDQHTYVLIVGNEDYRSRQKGLSVEQNVQYAVNDAVVFGQYCTKTLGIPANHVKILKNATATEMLQGLSWLSNLAKVEAGKAKLIFYYSGHGLPHQATKEPYLIPVDVSGNSIDYAIKLSEVYNKLREHPIERATVFLDACFSGGGRVEGLLAAKSVRIKPKEGMVHGNLVVFSSSSGDETSNIFNAKKHGYFTYYLLKKLQETKGVVTYAQLSDYINRQVSRGTALEGKMQTPQVKYSSAIGNEWENWKLK